VSILLKNKPLFWLGALHLFLAIFLLGYSFFYDEQVLGINAMYKPIKFALSIWVYSWTVALFLNLLDNQKKVKAYSWVAVIVMCFEQWAITSQALRGHLSHFNKTDTYGIIIFSIMGVFILTITLWTAYIVYLFIKQKEFATSPTIVLSIKIGLIYFVVFSLLGGYISSMPGHTVGANDGGKGLWFINWSKFFGDLRVAHFFGIHSLQVIPFFGYIVSKYFSQNIGVEYVKIFSIIYFLFVLNTLIEALSAVPFIK
jgi:hypothetical protein